MAPRKTLFTSLLLALVATAAARAKTVADYAEAAAEHDVVLTIPEFPKTPEAIRATVDAVIARITEVGDQVAKQDLSKVTFQSTIGVFDDLDAWTESRLNPIGIVENTSSNAELRKVATDEFVRFQQFAVGFSYREDIYKAVKAYADTKPDLDGAKQRLFADTMSSYKRRGFELSKQAREDVEAMLKEVSKLSTAFDENIREHDTIVKFTKAQLDGVPEDFLATVKTGEDEYSLSGKLAAHFTKVLSLANLEATRKEMLAARSRHVMDINVPILRKVVKLRCKIANRLGYSTWADYKTEDRMAKNEKTVRLFLQDLSRGLQPKFEEELAALREIKVRKTGDTTAEIKSWDTSYFENKLLQEKFSIDNEALRVFFPYENCLAGMFEVYETIFGLTIEEIANPDPWAEGVTLHAVTDTASGKPMGLFYLDMFPRDGKYNHFAQFGIILGKELADGTYQRPTVALICNFPKPQGDKPSLLSFDEVETLFHEFGHCMHSILTEAKFFSQSGTNVPRDFVEAPSQVLEYWIRDKQVLDLFAADYRDPSRTIPQEVVSNLEAADLAQAAMHYRGQIGYAMTDLLMHNFAHPLQVQDVGKLGNDVLATYFLARPEGTAFVAGFGHLMGYDAGYYGYAWSDVIAADIASVFDDAPGGFLNKELGMKLREEIFARGDSRDVSESVEAFLGRPRSMDAFLEMLGIKKPE